MALGREPSVSRSSFHIAGPCERTVMVVLLLMFFVLHVVAGVMLQGRVPTAAAPAQEKIINLLHD